MLLFGNIPPLVRSSWNLLKETGYYNYILVGLLVDIIMDVASSNFLVRISNGETSYIWYYVIIEFSHPLYENFYYSPISSRAGNKIQILFRESAYKRYDALSFTWKNKKPTDIFHEKMIKCSWALSSMIDWGLRNVIHLVSSTISCIIIFFSTSQYILFVMMLGINIIAYKVIIKRLQTDLEKTRKNNRDNVTRSENLISLNLPLFQQKEIGVDDMMMHETNILKGNFQINTKWDRISTITVLTNKLIMIAIALLDIKSVGMLLLMLKSVGIFNGAISSLMHFLNQYNHYDSQYEGYEEFWNETESKSEPIKLSLPSNIVIQKIDVNVNSFQLTGPPMSFHTNDKILIQGKSGHGKSTFLLALMGKIPGIDMAGGNPENWCHHYAWFFQDINEKLPVTKVTIRQLFHDDPNDHEIMKCCELCGIDNWVKKLATDDRVNLFDNTAKSILDTEIDKKLSGGEKSRLALATRIHQMIKDNKSILILDEPEQGLDRQQAYKIIKRILDFFPSKMVIIVSHLEKIREIHNWNSVLHVRKGVITVC